MLRPKVARKSSSHGNSSVAALALIAGLASAVVGAGCTSADPALEVSDEHALRGTLVSYVASFPDGSSETQYFLRTGGEDGPERRLIFASDPELSSGVTLDVWGADELEHLAVDRYALVDDGFAGRVSQPLVNGTALPPRTFAFVRVDLGGGFPDLTAEDATRRMFGTAAGNNSVKQYYLEVSYGRQDIQGEVIGPLPFTMNGCDTRGMAMQLRARVGTFQHYLWYMGTNASGCSWSGLAQTGSPQMPARDTWYNASEGCVVLVQEPGHNFGMQHSSALRCTGSAFADDLSSCRHDEYGDPYDPMGRGCRHMNVWQKAYQGWFGGCNSVRVGTSGTYTLLPTETPCDGVQVLQIPMPRSRPFARPAGGGSSSGMDQVRFYYLELRTRVGFDAQMMNAPTVLVHVADDYRSLQQGGRHTWILDMNPSTMQIDGLGVGQSYTDPAPGSGISFSVQALSAQSATIQVTMPSTPPQGFPAQNTCHFGGGTLTGSGPSSCGVGAPVGGSGGVGAGGMSGSGPVGGAGGSSNGGTNTGGASGAAGRAGGGGSAGAASGGSAGVGGSAGQVGGAGGLGGSGAAGGVAGAPGLAGMPSFAGSANLPSGGVSGAAAGAAGAPSAGVAGSGFDTEINQGCGCRVPARQGERPPGALALAAVALISLLRRRRRG